MSDSRELKTAGTGTLALIVAWTVVGAPLMWGVVQTVIKALPLFR